MSWLKGILGGVVGAEALTLIQKYVEDHGGLDGVKKEFTNSGFKRQIDSWIAQGPNLPMSGIEVQQALGLDKVVKIAKEAGLPVDKVRDILAEYLPTVVDKSTPEGVLPKADPNAKTPTKGY
jgi:uncharacterized protein YidB (DUF937 family)